MDIEPIQSHSNKYAQAGILPPAQVSITAGFQPAAAEASQRLSGAVLRRYGVVPAPADGFEPVLLQPPAGQVLIHTTRRYALHLAPQLRLTFTAGASSPAPGTAETAPGLAQVLRPERLPDRHTERQRWVETLVERLFARGERQSSIPDAAPRPSKTPIRPSGAPDTPISAASRLSDPGGQPLRMVLRKPAPALAPNDPQTPGERQSDAVQLTGAQWAKPALPPSMAPAPIDIQQITQQVIQTIDRKIIGQRERFGRI